MALQFPSWMEPLEWLVGSDWPHGNEDLMWQMGRDLQAAADEADLLLGDIDDLLSDVRKAYPEGTGGEQILNWLQPLRDGTGPEKNGSVQELAEHFQKLATAADGHGDQLQAAKLNFYIAAGWLLAECLWALAGGPFAPALHAAAIAAGRVVFKSLTNAFIRRILTNIASRITSSVLRKISPKLIYEIVQESIEETLQGTSQEMLVQYIQKKGGHIDEYDWQAVRDNAKISAIAGAAGGAAGFGASKLFPTGMGGFRGTLNGALTGASAGAVGALAAYGGGRLVTGQWGEFDPRSLTGGALSGALPSAIHGRRGMSPDAGPVRAPGTDPTTVPGTDTPGTTPGTNPSSNSPADTNGANNNPGAGQNGANAQGANQNGATNGENGGSNQPANSGDSGGKGSDTSGANHQGGDSAPSNNGESAPSNGKESGDSSGRGDGPAADTKGDSTTTGSDSNTKSDSTTSTDGKTDDSATTDGKTERNSSPDTNSDNRTETRSEADTKADQTGTALKDSSSQPNTAASLDTNTTTSHHTTNTTTTTANATPNTTAPNTTAPTTNAPNTSTATTANTSTTTSTANTSTSTTTPNSADTRAGDPAKSAPGPRADVGAPRPVAAPVMTTRASIGDATFAHPGAGIPIQAAQTGVEAAAKTEQTVEHQGPQSSPDVEQAVPIPVPMLPISVDPPAATPPADTTAEPQSERQMAKNFKANSTLPGGQITFGELSPKAKQLVNALAENAHIPISPGEVSIAHLAELQKFAGVEHAIAQNKNGDLRLFRGGTTRTRIPDDLKGEYDFIVHTHPEDRMPGPPSQWELYMGTHSHDSMDFDLRTKTSSYTEAVVSRDGQVRFFNNEGVFDLPVGVYPKGGPISDRGYVVPVPNLDSDFVGEKKISQDSDPDPLTENDPTPDTDRPESKSPPDTRQPGQDPGARQPAPDRSDTAPNVDTHLDEVLATHPDPESILTDLDGTTTVAAIADQMGITDPEQRQALQDVFEASRDNAAPFIVKVASDMLTNLKAAAALNPDLRVVFLGRDGHSLAMAMSQLDPAFVAQHGHEVTLSRALVETAVQDLEKNEGLDVSDVDGFRNTKGKVDPDSVDGAFVRLTEYFERLGIPMGVPGSDVALVDTSYKGTVQELLNAIYPETNFQGHFMFYAASPVDPHPDNKLGYALDLDVENGNDGYPVKEMPADPARTFQQQDALGSIEEVFHGPLGSPKSIGPDGLPSQELQRHESDPLVGLNPETVSDRFSDPLLREAAKRVALLPVAQIAHDIATQRAAGVDVDADLQARYDNYVDQVRAWVEGDPSVNPKFAEVMDSFVRRADKSEVRSLADLIEQAGLNPDEAKQVWRDYADNTTLADKKAFVQQFADAHPNPESTREITRPPENNQPHPESTDPNDPLQSGGSTRPRDVLDPEIQGAWANAAYDAFRASPSDVDDMHRNLADVERLDGTTGFTRQEIEQVKRHLFEQEHQLSVFDDDGNVVGYESRRFDADPDIAEAWMRLSRGVPLPADIRLLEHELAEADFLRRNPDATYREAHAYANSQSNWESDIPNRTGENYERWAAKDGGVHRVPEIDPNTDNPDVPVREQPGESRPPSGDPDGRHGRQTGGRLEQPTGDEGRGPHSGPVESGRDLAGRGRDSSLEPGRREEAGNRPPTPPQDSARPDSSQQQPGHSPQPNMAAPQPNFQQGLPQNPNILNPSPDQMQLAAEARQFREVLRNLPAQTVVPVSNTQTPGSDIAYEFRRHPHEQGGPVGMVSMKVHVTHDGTVSPEQVEALWNRAQMAVDLQFNHAQRLLSGDRVLVDLAFTADPSTANVKLHVSQNAPGAVNPNADLGSLATQLTQQLGLPQQQGPGLDQAALRQLSNNIAKSNTPAKFRRLEDGHRYEPGKLQPVEHAAYQHAVEDALRQGNRFMVGADPRTNPYGKLINDGGHLQPGRGNNCLVQSLAALSSFHGDPQVGPPRWPDLTPTGDIDEDSGEQDGLQRAQDFLGGKWQNYATPGKSIAEQFAALHDWIQHMGPGSSALVHNIWQAVDPQTGQPLFNADGTPMASGSSHATAIVFPHGAKGPVWWDPQMRTMSDTPPIGMISRSSGLEFMVNQPASGAPNAPGNKQGTSPTAPTGDIPVEGELGDTSVQSGLGDPVDSDTRADSERPGPGPDSDGDRRERRDDPAVPELGDTDGDRGLHQDEGGRTTPERAADLSAPDPSESDTDTRGRRDDSLPDSSRLDGNPSTPDPRVPTDHRQADTAPRTDRARSDDRGVLGGLETEAAERSLARNGLDGVLAPDSTAPQQNTNESVATDIDRPADLTDDAGATPQTQDPDDNAPSPQEQAILDAVERLTPAERDALQDYAGDAYNEINRHLRYGEPLDTVSPETIDLIRSGLDKLPDYVGPVKRSIMLSPEQMESFWNANRKGAVVEDPAFVSTSKTKFKWNPNVKLTILSATGKDISYLQPPAKRGEQEVLIPDGRQFRVLNRVMDENGVMHVTWAEIADAPNSPDQVFANPDVAQSDKETDEPFPQHLLPNLDTPFSLDFGDPATPSNSMPSAPASDPDTKPTSDGPPRDTRTTTTRTEESPDSRERRSTVPDESDSQPSDPGGTPRSESGRSPRPDDEWSRMDPQEVAAELDERWGVDAVGFDNPNLDPEAVREFARAVDEMLFRYPDVDLDRVEIRPLGRDTYARATSYRHPDGTHSAGKLALNERYATNLELMARHVAADEADGHLVPGSADRPVYSTLVHEFGHSIAFEGQEKSAATALDALKDYYEKTRGRMDTAGFEAWLAQLSGYSFYKNGRFDADEALAEAFTDVELNGEAASEPAKVLFWHLLDGARQDSPIPNSFDSLPADLIARPTGLPDAGTPKPVAPVLFSHADEPSHHQRTRSEQDSPDPEQQPKAEQEPDATEPSLPETSQPETSESPEDRTRAAEPSQDIPENDRPDTLTDHLRSRFEQLRSIATDIILAEQDPALHGELPSLRDDYASLLDKLGMLDPATADTPWRLLDQHQSALAEYLSTNHTFLVPSVSDPVAVTDETTAPEPTPATTESALAPQDTTAPTQQPAHSPIPTPAPISAAEIEAVHGIPVENQRKIQEYADNNNLRFDVRPTNPDAVRHLQAGRMPKPMEIKDKTINDLDIALGAPAEHKGLVGRFAPGMLEMPDTTGMTDAEIAALEKRLADRTKDFASYQKKMAEYADKFEVREDGVVQAILPDQSRVPITGDHDMFDLRHADGTRLSPAELAHHEIELSKIKAGIMHGPHVYWNPDADQRIRNFEPIVNNHQYDPANPSAEPLIRFQPNQDPQVTWAAMDLDAINRDMTPWHLETGLQKLLENTATRLEQAAPEQDTRARVESDIDQLRNIANELSRHPDFDHATYLSLLTGVPVTPETADSPAHKMATIALEARNGTDPADIVRMVRDAPVPVTTTAPSTETGSDTSTDPEKNDPDDDTPPAEPAPRNPDRGPSGPPKGPSEAAPTEPGPTRPEAADLTGQPAVDSTLDPTTPGPSETTPADSEPARHDHTTAPTTTDAKVVADLNEHPGGVEIDADGLLKTVDGRPIQEHVDTMARERAEAFRTAAAEFSQRPGEKPIKTQKRVLQAQQNGTYVSPKTHGQVTAVVQDLRTGIAYEGVNGTADNVIPENELHPTLRANIEAMEARAREQEQGGYEALDRNGNPERNPETFEGFPEGTRPHPHFDDPYGHAEVKAANEALWARERENDQRRADGRTDLLPTGPEALAEMYSQTYKPFATDGPEATPYCANCDQTMLQAHNFSGRYTGFPPSTENLTDAYEPAPNPEAEPASAPTDVDDSAPPSDPAGAGPIDTGDTDEPSREKAKPSENPLPQQDTDDIPPLARGVDPVTPEQLERIFHEQIVPKLLSGATSVPDTETPEVVVVGGQMGAGKSTMIADVVATFADRGGVTQISGDDFFKFHPRYPELMATHDADAIRHLLADARPWFRMALEHVMANRQNVILELAMGDPVKEAGLIREFVDNGYTARAEVMAVSEPQSRLSTINRYLSERIDDGVHRYTPPWLHDASYTGSQQMVGELESDAPPVRLESLTVRSRTETLYQNTRDEDGNWTEPPRAAEVLSGERDRPWTPDEKQLYQEQLAQVRQRMAEMAAQRPAETETLETLGRDLRATEDNARPRFDTETPPVRLDEDTGRPPEPADTETATRRTQTAQAQQQVSTVAEQQHEFLRAAEQRDLDASDPVVHEQIRASYVRAHELVDLATASNKAALRILAVIDEWHPSKGGVIAVNKNLCEALAALGHEVFVRVGHELTGNEGADTVTLIAPRTSDPNTPLRDQLVSDMGDLPAGIDAVIGHTRFSGPAARDIRNTMYPEATLVHMVHMVTDALGRVQGKPEKAAVNHEIEADLVSTSDVAVGVGPALSEEAARLAAMTDASPVLHQLNPGVEFFDQVRPPAERRTMRMLVFGRADDPVKGAMQAAKMVQALNARGIDVDLIVRGVPEAKVADQRRLLTRAAGREVDVRPYTLDRDEILADMRDANVVLMPSLAEGFGLVATEAAGAGVPMVLPSTSGAGRFFGDHTVFPSELTDGMFVEQGYESPVSVEAWAAVLESQLSDQDGAWDRALQLQQILRDQQFTWESAATALIDATRAVPPADKPVAGIPGQNPDVDTPPSARAGLPSAPSNPVANRELSTEDTVPRRESEPDSSPSGRASVPDSSAPGRASVPDSSTPSEPATPNMTQPAEESTMTGPQPEQTPAGASFHPDPADPVAELARRVQPDPDRFTVDAHVDADGNFRVGDRTYTPEEFANLLRRTGWDGTTPIRLIGCDAATNGAATRLAQALGVDVLAPTKPAWTDARGNVFTSSTEIGPDGNRRPRIPPDGVWETHHADGSKTKATDDGYAPGSRADSARPTDADSARDRAAGPIDPGKTNESTDAANSHDSSTSSGPRGPMADPQPTWHGQTAAKMRHYRLPVEDVSALSPAEQLEALRQRTQELANEARKPDMTEAEKQAYSRMSFPKGQNKIPQGCAGTLLHNDTMTSHTSVTKMDNQAQPLTHPVLQALYDQVRADYVAGKIQEIGNGHGKCAEVALISDRLLQLEAAGIRIDSVEAARRALEGAQINTRRIGDFRDKEGNVINHHGQPIPPCDSCKHVLPQLGIEPV